MHIGTAYIALFNYAFAHKKKGEFVVRIEDTDRSRLVHDAEQAIYDGLEWLGLNPDESPEVGGGFGPYRQSDRKDLYLEHAHQLVDQGHAYYCFCTAERLDKMRKQQRARKEVPRYDRRCLALSQAEIEDRLKQGEAHVIRLKVKKDQGITFHDLVRGEITFNSNDVDDQVLIKSDGFPTYHLAVVVDDHLMQISHIIRGEEWISSVPKHILLYQAFDWPLPVFVHTPIIRNPDMSKMSKRHGHADLRWFRQAGYLPEALLNYFALLGWSHPQEQEFFDLTEFIELFELTDIKASAPIFDLEKLKWINGVYIRKMTRQKLVTELRQLSEVKDQEIDDRYFEKIVALTQERLKTLNEFWPMVEYFFAEPTIEINTLNKYIPETDARDRFLKEALRVIEGLTDDWQAERIEARLREVQQEQGLKPKQAFMALRVVVSGQEQTPPLFDMLETLGFQTVLQRITKYVAHETS